ncbi:MAG: J domain-containing protein [Nitrospirota bacterium]|jgi:DnaJ-class molecular chaperone
MATTDLYADLGLKRDASGDEIKRAYRRLARKFHPDVNPGNRRAEERFKKISRAYDVLGDPEKRARYDRYGEAGVNGGGFAGGPHPSGGFSGGPFAGSGGGGFGGFEGFGDIFEQLFRGGGTRAQGSAKGADVETRVTLTLEEAAHGVTRRIFLGDGAGVDVKIPAGVDTGTKIRVAGKGRPGVGGGPAGDLFAIVEMASHPYFRRDGSDLYLDLPLTIVEATLGTQVRIPTLDGRTQLTVPGGVASGAKLRLRGKGLPATKGGQRGDQFAVVKIVPPKNVPPADRARLRDLGERICEDPRAGLPWAAEGR